MACNVPTGTDIDMKFNVPVIIFQEEELSMHGKKRRKLDKLNKMAVRLQITGIGHYILFLSILGEKRTHTQKK